jgi:hypothetical protein
MIRIPRCKRDRSERPRGFSTWTRAAGCNGESFSVSSDFRMQFRNCPTLPKPIKIIHYFIWCNTYLMRRLSFFRIIFKRGGSEHQKSERRRVRTSKFFWEIRTSKVKRSELQKSLRQKERQKSEKLDFRHSDLF